MPRAPAKPRRHGSGWQIRYTDQTGRRHGLTFESYADAKAALAKIANRRIDERRAFEAEEAAALAGEELVEPPLRRTFDELADYWLQTRAKEKRSGKHDASVIKKHLRPSFGGQFLDRLGVEGVDRFKAERSHLKAKTIHNLLTLLVSMLNLAVDLGWLEKPPRIRKPKVKVRERDFRYLRTQEEVRRFLDAAEGEAEAAELLVILPLYAAAIFTGMRAGELAGLRWSDVSFEQRLITVQRTYEGQPTKSGEVRYVPMLDALLPVLRDWRLRNGLEVVFPSQKGTSLGRSARPFQEVLHRVLKRGGFEKGYVRFHDLRHTFASHWMMNGGDLFKLQRILGHADQTMTQRYAHLAPNAFGGDLGRLGDLAPVSGSLVSMRR
ncbi:MAG: site-specific integrase [Myxococcota bacterium]